MSKAIAINTTRRDFMTAMSAVVAATIPTVAIASVPVSGDAAIFAYEPELMEAHGAFLAALDVQARADERYFAGKPIAPVAPPYGRASGVPVTIDDVAIPTSPDGDWDAYYAAKAARKAADDGWREASGAAVAEAASGEALDRLGEIADAILAIPATTIEGVRFKLRLTRTATATDILDAVIEDIAAITGKPIDVLT